MIKRHLKVKHLFKILFYVYMLIHDTTNLDWLIFITRLITDKLLESYQIICYCLYLTTVENTLLLNFIFSLLLAILCYVHFLKFC